MSDCCSEISGGVSTAHADITRSDVIMIYKDNDFMIVDLGVESFDE